jgi:hypothetical protein
VSIETLLKKATRAKRPERIHGGKYARLVPVVEKLIRDCGFSVGDAVRWLISEGEIPGSKFETARVAFSSRLKRKAERSTNTK